MESKHRNFCFTSYIKGQKLSSEKFSYIVYGKEICPDTGRHHLQGYVEFSQSVSFKVAQKRIGDPTCHIALRLGTAREAADYCKKDGDFIEVGIISKPGERTDLQLIKDRILKGDSDIRGMLEEDMVNNPQQLRFAEGLLKYRRNALRDPPICNWFYGQTGTNKSRTVWDKEGLDLYVVEPGFEWFDGYVGQEAVLFDDFRGQITLCTLLRILDRYPLRLKMKGGFINWKPLRIYITSSKTPQECYKNCGENIDQLIRRLNSVTEFCAEVGGNTSTPTL